MAMPKRRREDDPEWEDVASPQPGDYTQRLKVPGGYLYRTHMLNSEYECVSIAMVFIPVPDLPAAT